MGNYLKGRHLLSFSNMIALFHSVSFRKVGVTSQISQTFGGKYVVLTSIPYEKKSVGKSFLNTNVEYNFTKPIISSPQSF